MSPTFHVFFLKVALILEIALPGSRYPSSMHAHLSANWNYAAVVAILWTLSFLCIFMSHTLLENAVIMAASDASVCCTWQNLCTYLRRLSPGLCARKFEVTDMVGALVPLWNALVN
jgi:hypothetical protein